MTPPTTAAATVRDVSMRFREHTALDGVSTVVERDSITGSPAATVPARPR